jgi:hypothetical protein
VAVDWRFFAVVRRAMSSIHPVKQIGIACACSCRVGCRDGNVNNSML